MRKVHVLHSALAPEEITEALRRDVEREQGAEGLKNMNPLHLQVDQNTFQLRRRRTGRNDFPCLFYGRFEPEPNGTRIEGYFDFPGWTIWFLRIWLGLIVLIAALIFLGTLFYAVREHNLLSIATWIGLLIPPALVLVALAIPKIARMLSRKDEQYILQFVQSTLAGQMEESSPDRQLI